MYDLIGDIHGHADALKRLLTKMDYVEKDGVWAHPNPDRKVIFLGDFIDRGPAQVETVNIARGMVDAGKALAVMGNHEFNAIAWASPDPSLPTGHRREHSPKNRRQHRAYLEQVGENSPLHRNHIEWFQELPLYLDLDGLRVVHACWHQPSLDRLADLVDEGGRAHDFSWGDLTKDGTAAFEAAEVLLKGLEIPLKPPAMFYDKDEHPRHSIRTRWWEEAEQLTYRNVAMVPDESLHRIPDKAIPAALLPGYDNQKPVFVGHYWLTGEPAPLSSHVACVDYSIGDPKAGDSRKLVAYRWDGESEIKSGNYCWVDGT